MHINHKNIIIILIFIIPKAIICTSMVYNFRIAQITKQPISDEIDQEKNMVMGLIFDIYKKKYNGQAQNFVGELSSYIRNFGLNYFRVDWAFANIKEQNSQAVNFSGTQTDDLLFTIGRDYHIGTNSKLTLSGLLGLPTHANNNLQHASFGYGQVGLGAQLDGIYNFNTTTALIYGTRYVFLAKRNTRDNDNNQIKFTAGNVLDLLIASKYNWDMKHGIEAGFTERFQFGAKSTPYNFIINNKSNYLSSNFYLVYKYKFLLENYQNRLLLNIAYGFDQSSKATNNKNIVTVWGSWSINF